MTLYKRAGLLYGERRYGGLVANIAGAGLLKPGFLLRRLIDQKMPILRKL